MAAPSSLQTIPSQITMTSATIQPSIACGPPSAVMSSGIVMNGPTPSMLVMFSAVAGRRLKRRGRCGCSGGVAVSAARDVLGSVGFVMPLNDRVAGRAERCCPSSARPGMLDRSRGASAGAGRILDQRMALGVDHERRRLGGDQILELAPELLERQTRRCGELRQLMWILEIVTPKANHVPTCDAVACRVNIQQPHPSASAVVI